jgi:hypothetical protein
VEGRGFEDGLAPSPVEGEKTEPATTPTGGVCVPGVEVPAAEGVVDAKRVESEALERRFRILAVEEAGDKALGGAFLVLGSVTESSD